MDHVLQADDGRFWEIKAACADETPAVHYHSCLVGHDQADCPAHLTNMDRFIVGI